MTKVDHFAAELATGETHRRDARRRPALAMGFATSVPHARARETNCLR